MKRMKTTIYSLSAAILFSGAAMLSSCEDYLTTLPTDSLVSDGAITTPEDTKVAVNGLYEGLIAVSDPTTGSAYYYYGVDFIARPEVGADDIRTRLSGDRTQNFYRFTDRQSNATESLWYAPYAIINRANVLLQAIDSGTIEMNDMTRNAKGEALAVRALCHFNLLITYGYPYQKDNGASLGVPIVKTVLDAAELPMRSTVAEGYQAVIDDLNEALEYINDDISVDNYGHLNSWGVKSLLARVNLYKGNYDAAYDYAKEVVENSGYSLVPHDSYLGIWAGDRNNESIFDLVLSPTTYGGSRELWGAVVSPTEYGAVVVTNTFYHLLNEDPNDVRLGLLIPSKEEGVYTINKYPGRNGGSVAVNNMRIIRLSEMYLTGAEAALRKSSPDQTLADNYLDAIRRRANPDCTHETATIDLVEKERRKELVMEGHRLFDILRVGEVVKRTGTDHFLNMTDLTTITWDDYRIVMPIPQAEMDANSNMIQNPEY